MMRKDRIYVLLTRFARAMRVDGGTVYNWEKNGFLNAIRVGNQKMLLREDVNKFLHDWRRSCKPVVAAKLIGIKGGTIGHYIKAKVVKTIEIFRLNRVLLSSIPEAKKYAAGREKRLHKKAVDMGRSGLGHRFTSTEVYKMWRKKGRLWRKERALKKESRRLLNEKNARASLSIYVPVTKVERNIIGTRRLVTILSAANFLDVPEEKVIELMLQGDFVGNKYLLLARAVEIYKRKT